MVDRSVTIAFMRLQRQNLRARLGALRASSLDSKMARTYSDDVDVCHGVTRRTAQLHHERPGLRDDESLCTYGRVLPA
jgi:hypothetical protein